MERIVPDQLLYPKDVVDRYKGHVKQLLEENALLRQENTQLWCQLRQARAHTKRPKVN